MTGPDLKPCPFCGTTEMLRTVGASDGHGWGFVRCDYCDAEGPDPDNFPGGWNRRTPDPAAEIARLTAERDAAQADAEDWARKCAAADGMMDAAKTARQADLAKAYGPILDLLPDAVRAAEKAMRKYPQPNYVISKWAEETGEVTKDLIHMAEGRQTADKLRGEIVQSLAMLHRLMVEGDQVHGLPPVGPAIRALTPPADMAARIGGAE